MASDEAGVIHVFEAIITGVIVLTAILFLTALSGPSTSEGATSIDLGRIARDTLDIMGSRPATDCRADEAPVPPDPPDPLCPVHFSNRLEQLVDTAMRGQTTAAEEAFLDEVLPPGTRYLLRLDNGVEPITLLPEGSGPVVNPRGAQAAEVLLMPPWQVFIEEAVTLGTASPGDTLASACTTPVPPTGAAQAPGGVTWESLWNGATGVPLEAPYGIWHCGGTDYLRITPPSGQAADFPLYAVQLVVWPGA